MTGTVSADIRRAVAAFGLTAFPYKYFGVTGRVGGTASARPDNTADVVAAETPPPFRPDPFPPDPFPPGPSLEPAPAIVSPPVEAPAPALPTPVAPTTPVASTPAATAGAPPAPADPPSVKTPFLKYQRTLSWTYVVPFGPLPAAASAPSPAGSRRAAAAQNTGRNPEEDSGPAFFPTIAARPGAARPGAGTVSPPQPPASPPRRPDPGETGQQSLASMFTRLASQARNDADG